MKTITITLDGDSPKHIEIDGELIPIESFLLTTNVTNRETGHFIAFGNTDTIGKMLYSFWRWSARGEGDSTLAYVMELVAQDILADAQRVRGELFREATDPGATH